MAANVSPRHAGLSELDATQEDGKARSAAMSVHMYCTNVDGYVPA
jgi:hypothetical protein